MILFSPVLLCYIHGSKTKWNRKNSNVFCNSILANYLISFQWKYQHLKQESANWTHCTKPCSRPFFFFFFKLSCIGTEPHSCFYILSVAVFASRQGWLIMTENMSCKVLNIYYLAFYKGSLPTPDLKQRWNSEVQFQNSAETILLLSWYPRSCQINGEKWPAWCRKADKPARTISL